MANINLGQNSPSQVPGSYTFQLYWNAQVNQDMKGTFPLQQKRSFSKELNI